MGLQPLLYAGLAGRRVALVEAKHVVVPDRAAGQAQFALVEPNAQRLGGEAHHVGHARDAFALGSLRGDVDGHAGQADDAATLVALGALTDQPAEPSVTRLAHPDHRLDRVVAGHCGIGGARECVQVFGMDQLAQSGAVDARWADRDAEHLIRGAVKVDPARDQVGLPGPNAAQLKAPVSLHGVRQTAGGAVSRTGRPACRTTRCGNGISTPA